MTGLRLFVFISLALLAACGPPPDGPPPGELTPCALAIEIEGDSTTNLVAGQTAVVRVVGPSGSRDVAVDPEESAATFELTKIEGDANEATFDLFVRYDSPDEADMAFRADCSDIAGSEPEGKGAQTFTVRIPKWTASPTWTAGQDGPPGREYFSFWVDPNDDDTAFVLGGFHYEPVQFTIAWDVWRLSLTDLGWTELATSGATELAGRGTAPGRNPNEVILYGGLGREGDDFLLPFSLDVVTLGETDASWGEVAPADAPGFGTYQPAFFYDEPRGRYLAIGGQGAMGTHMQVSAYDPNAGSWQSLVSTVGARPSGRTGFFWAHDPATERFIVFSGEMGGGAGGGCNCAQDTWALDLTQATPEWVLLAGDGEGPPGRRNGSYALDPVRHRLLVWGGTSDGATTQPGLWALRLDPGKERWDEVVVEPATVDGAEVEPAIRSSGGMIYDAPRDRMLVGFGNDSIVGAHEDLWGLEF